MSSKHNPRLEEISFWTLVMLTVGLGAAISTLGLWIPGKGAIIDAPQNQGESVALFLTNAMMGIMQAIAIVALFSRRVRFTRVLIVALLIMPTSYLGPKIGDLINDRAIINDIDDIIRFGLIFGLAQVLILPWIFPRMKWPRRTAPNLSASIALFALLLTQGSFHLGLVWSGWGFRDARVVETVELIENTTGPQELYRLGELEVLPLQNMTPDNAVSLFEADGVIDIEEKMTGLTKLWHDSPDSLFIWEMDGHTERDPIMVVFDGRAEPQTWFIPSHFFNERRVYSVSAMFFLSGIATSTWALFALIVVRTHQRGGCPSARKSRSIIGAGAARSALLTGGGVGLAITLVMTQFNPSVAGYLVTVCAVIAIVLGLYGGIWGSKNTDAPSGK